MTPQEAMRKAVAAGLGLTAYDDPNPEEAAAAILAALPEGWMFVTRDMREMLVVAREQGAQQERERLRALADRFDWDMPYISLDDVWRLLAEPTDDR